MGNLLESIFLVSAVLGFLLSTALMTHIFRPEKTNFFLGLIVFLMALELLFSWGFHSGYNNSQGAFPFWVLLTYHIIPPSVWLFVRGSFDTSFQLRRWHALLFLPALAEIGISSSSKLGFISFKTNLMNYWAWIWFVDYIPLSGFIFSLGYFWIRYFQAYQRREFKPGKNGHIPHAKLLLIMCVLSLICLLWVIFTFMGWENFSIIEFLLVSQFLAFSFLVFLDNRPFPAIEKRDKNNFFSNYDDQKQLMRLSEILEEKQLFVKPNLSLKELSQEMNLPSRYLSYLINRYHHKNFKEFINEHRIEAFIAKARSPESTYKTLLALAFESGFNSKSTFNQAFKDHKGKPPSEYLALRHL